MKTKNVIIGLLAIGIIVLGVLYYQECNKKVISIIDNKPVPNNEFRRKVCCLCVNSTRKTDGIDSNQFPCTNGSLHGKDYTEYQVDEVSEMILAAKKLNPCNEIYGYQISLHYVEEMLDSIQKYNKDPNQEDKVCGVRFYEAVSEREFDGEKLKKVDLVMIPYLMSGKDVFDVDHPMVPSSFKMYAHFRPCPRLCAKENSFFGKKL